MVEFNLELRIHLILLSYLEYAPQPDHVGDVFRHEDSKNRIQPIEVGYLWDVECISNNLVVLDLNLSLGCFVQGPEVNELIVDLGEQISLGDDDSVTD